MRSLQTGDVIIDKETLSEYIRGVTGKWIPLKNAKPRIINDLNIGNTDDFRYILRSHYNELQSIEDYKEERKKEGNPIQNPASEIPMKGSDKAKWMYANNAVTRFEDNTTFRVGDNLGKGFGKILRLEPSKQCIKSGFLVLCEHTIGDLCHSNIDGSFYFQPLVKVTHKRVQAAEPVNTRLDKAWTILEFQSVENKRLWDRKINRKYAPIDYENGGVFDLDSMLHSEGCVDSGKFVICKVRRNSDGAVFSLGQMIAVHAGKHAISKFEVSGNNMVVKLYNDNCWGCTHASDCSILLHNINHVISTVEVPIEKPVKVPARQEGRRSAQMNDADYYGIECLSINDIFKIYPSAKNPNWAQSQKLIKLVKSKLNNKQL